MRSASTSFSLNLIRPPCSITELSIDASVFEDSLPLVYNIGITSTSTTYQLNLSKVIVTPPESASICPPIYLDVVLDDAKTFDNNIFAFNSMGNEFTVTTADKTLVETYQLKVIAKLENEGISYDQSA